MEDVSSPTVQVVLSIKEGKGFQQISLPTAIVATLNGHSLETDVIDASSAPQYVTDLVWEVDKNKLRKMRSGQAPLKVECFGYKTNEIREKLGYILLSVRSAQIISKSNEYEAKATWHKLLGLRSDLKADKPELFLALSIHEQDQSVLPEKQSQDKLDSMTEKIIPVLMPDERLIQLGPLNNCQDIFLLNVIAISAGNINSLLPEETSVTTNDDLNFWCQIFDNNIYFKPFKRESNDTILFNEKIVIRIRSSVEALKEYLKAKPNLIVYLKYRNKIVGQSKVSLVSLLSYDNNEQYINDGLISCNVINRRCFLHVPERINIENELEVGKPYVDLQMKLQQLGHKSDLVADGVNSLTKLNNGSGDARSIKTQNDLHAIRNVTSDSGKNHIRPQLSCQNVQSLINGMSINPEVIQSNSITVLNEKSVNTVQCQCNKNSLHMATDYHCYYLNIMLDAIKLLSSKLIQSHIEIRFHHPKSGAVTRFFKKMPLVVGELTKIQNVDYKLHFISTPEEVKNLVVGYPPKFSIHADDESRTCISQHVFDTRKLLFENKPECQYTVSLNDIPQNQTCDLLFLLRLEDHGLYNPNSKIATTDNLGPSIIEDNLMYKIVDELERWKDRQKEIFKFELKKKEERHLNLLSTEWQQQKEALESKLACSVEQCKMLANSLNNATNDLRNRRLKSLEKEARLIKANEDLQWRYENKLEELRASLSTMKEELTSKISALEKQNITLEAQVGPATIENERLRTIVKKQAEELEAYQKASLTQDQTANLLQELKTLEQKLHQAQESKAFFKEQWGRAVRELHDLKRENQEAIQVQIKNSKEEIENLDLEEILRADSAALMSDQILLEQMQKEINSIAPPSPFTERRSYNQTFTSNIYCPDSHILQNINKTCPKKGDNTDEHLQALIEERDSLLRTGSYSNDDTVIIKLNAEIRSLMIR